MIDRSDMQRRFDHALRESSVESQTITNHYHITIRYEDRQHPSVRPTTSTRTNWESCICTPNRSSLAVAKGTDAVLVGAWAVIVGEFIHQLILRM